MVSIAEVAKRRRESGTEIRKSTGIAAPFRGVVKDTKIPGPSGPAFSPDTEVPQTIGEEIEGRRRLWKGGPLADLGDVLQIPQSATAPLFAKGVSALSGKGSDIAKMGVGEALRKRVAPSDVAVEQGIIPQRGVGRVAGGLATDIIVDPLNLAAGLGIGGKLVRGAGELGDVPRLVGAGEDIMRFAPKLEPFHWGGKALKPLAGPLDELARPVLKTLEDTLTKGDDIGKAVTSIKPRTSGDIVGDIVRKTPVGRAFMKAPEELREADVLRRGEMAVGRKRVKEVSELLSDSYTKQERVWMDNLMRDDTFALPKGISKGTKEKVEKGAQILRTDIDQMSQTLADMLRKDADIVADAHPRLAQGQRNLANKIEANKGQYVITQYEEFLNDPEGFLGATVGKGKKINILTRNPDIPDEVREAWTRIEDAGYTVPLSMQNLNKYIANSRFLRFVSDRFSTVDETVRNTVKIPARSEYGALAGKWVDPVVNDEIRRITDIKVTKGLRKALDSSYGKFLNWWKQGKVLVNPATQSRNFFSNMMLLDLAQYPVFSRRGMENFVETIQDLRTGGGDYAKALESGLSSTTFTREELLRNVDGLVDEMGKTGNPISGMFNTIKKIDQGLKDVGAKTFQANEEFAKLALFKWRLKQGDDVATASKYARKWLFDYADIPEAVRHLRKVPFGYPFLTFTYKSVPLFAETAVKRPASVSKYFKAFRNIEQGNRQTEREALPEYMQKGTYLRLPWSQTITYADGSKKEQPVYLDLNYILPWGDIGRTGQTLTPGGDIMGSIVSGVLNNKHPFFGTPIWKETDTSVQKTSKVANFLYKAIFPSIYPQIPATDIEGGYSWDKVANAIRGTPDSYSGALRNIPTALIDAAFGIKMKPVDVEREKVKRGKEFKGDVSEIKANITRLRSDFEKGVIDEEEYERKTNIEIDKIKDLREEFLNTRGPNLQPGR